MCPENQNLLGFKIKTISRLLSLHMDRHIGRLELTGSQGMVLDYLCAQQGAAVYPRDLERQFGFSHPTISGLLQRLEAKGFIRSEAAQEDRRCRRLAPTDKAVRLHQQMQNMIRRSDQLLSAGMSEAELATLHRLLDRMIQNINPSSEEGGIRS